MDGGSSRKDALEIVLKDPNALPCDLPLQYLREVTNDFSNEQELGRGGFGVVYKGVLPSGDMVAVKALLPMLQCQEKQFKYEVDNLMRVRHQNIVRFVGYCYETQYEYIEYSEDHVFAEKPNMLLCFEYISNGSLDKYISEECHGLDWHNRYEIIKGICCGLNYLHNECQIKGSVIHLDLKPENILLDNNMMPKIADFGLAKLLDEKITQTCATALMVSCGYTAPEYLFDGIISREADIYSLGVIIIQMITGHRVNPYDNGSLCQDFVELVVQNWRNRIDGAPSETDCKQIKGCLEIGLTCIKINRAERPTVKEIIEMLSIWENTHCYVREEEMAAANQLEPHLEEIDLTDCHIDDKALKPLLQEVLPRALRAFPSLTSLDLSACAGLDDASLAAALAGELGVRRVRLARASRVGWRGLEALVAACLRLEAIDMSHCVAAGDREMAALATAAGLRELVMDKCLGVTDIGLAKVAVGCPRLERLSVKWCREISDIGIEVLANKCPSLRSVDISYLKVSNESLRALSILEKLEDITMVYCLFIDDDGLQMLSAGKSLQSVDVSRCPRVTSHGLASLVDGQRFIRKINAGHSLHQIETCFLSKLSTIGQTLTVLRLDGLEIFASNLQAIGDSCKNLVEIGLRKCNGVTDDGISSLVINCSHLRTIDITCCHLLTNDALAAVAENCRMVEYLQLEFCSYINEKGLERIGTLCSHLKKIDLTDCRINDEALQHLASCSQLQILKLGLCSSISNKGLLYIGSNCGKLVELDLYRCSAITDEGLAALVHGCKMIRMLNLCYCTQISDAGLNHLSALEQLTHLEMRCLVRVTSIGITSIAIGCTRLIKLDLKHCYFVDDDGLSALSRYSQNLRQLTISYCQVTGLGLSHLLGSLRCLQDVKMVLLSWVSIEGFEMALQASCERLKKLKLLGGLRSMLSPELLQILEVCGCRLRWVNKPLVYKHASGRRTPPALPVSAA